MPATVTNGFCADDINPPGPDQLNAAPAEEELPESNTWVLEQEITAFVLATALTEVFPVPVNCTLSK